MLDVKDILRLSRTCKCFFQTCSLRSLWLSVLDELDFHATPNLPPHLPLTAHSTEVLRNRAINADAFSRISRGLGRSNLRFKNVSHIYSPVPEKRTFSIFRRVDPFLLPGGERLLVNNFGRLELWAVGSDDPDHRRLWQTESSSDTDVVVFNGEVVDSGAAVMIACLFMDRRPSLPLLRVFKFVESTQKSHIVCETRVKIDVSHVLMIRGNHVLLYQLQSFELRVLDWTTSEGRVVDFKDKQNRTFRIRSALLVEDSLVVTGDTGETRGEGTLQVFAVQAHNITKKKGNRQTFQISHPEELRDTKGTWGLAINAFRPFWRKTPNVPVELCVVALKFSEQRILTMKSYRLQVHNHEPPQVHTSVAEPPQVDSLKVQVKDVSSTTCMGYPNAGALSNAALIFTLNTEFKCFAAFCSEVQPSPINLKKDESLGEITRSSNYSVSIEPWSNAISVGSEGLIAILKFD